MNYILNSDILYVNDRAKMMFHHLIEIMFDIDFKEGQSRKDFHLKVIAGK